MLPDIELDAELKEAILELSGHLCVSWIRDGEAGHELVIAAFVSRGRVPLPDDIRKSVSDIRVFHRLCRLRATQDGWAMTFDMGQIMVEERYPTRAAAMHHIKQVIEDYWSEKSA